MIRLSYSLIRDYLSCPKRAYYRINFPEQSVQTEEMITGIIVHEILERYWTNRILAINSIDELIKKYNLSSDYLKNNIKICINNFFNNLHYLVNTGDDIEKFFRIPFNKDIMVGKFDRVTKDGVIIDWKTSPKTMGNFISNESQFIIYYRAYQIMYGKEPTHIFYVSLLRNKIVEFIPDWKLINELWDVVIPNIANEIRNKNFTRAGLFNDSCKNCQFQAICFKELNNL